MLLSFTAPVNIRFPPQSITDVSFVVQWDAVINQSVNRYIVSVHQTNNSKHIRTVTVHGKTTYNVTGLTPRTTYTVTIASVNASDCTGVASAGEEVTTDVSVSVNTISTIDTFRSPSVNPTITTVTDDTSVPSNVINATIDSVLTVTVTIMLATTPMSTMNATKPVSTTGKQLNNLIMPLIHM